MKFIIIFLFLVGQVMGDQIDSKLIGDSVLDLIAALKKSKVINNDFTTHKLEIEKFEGKGAGYNIIIKVYDPLHPDKVSRKIHCQTFYKNKKDKMLPDFEKMDCK